MSPDDALTPDSKKAARSRETTVELVDLARQGDTAALNRLLDRYRSPLRRWASGRLPFWARDFRDTEDLVQDTLYGVMPHVASFEYRRDGAFQAFLRHALMNRIRKEIRRAHRRPLRVDAEVEPPDSTASPLEEAIGREAVECYEQALQRLRPEEQAAIVARIEMRLNYEQVAQEIGKPSSDAARMAVSRALLRLAREMRRAS